MNNQQFLKAVALDTAKGKMKLTSSQNLPSSERRARPVLKKAIQGWAMFGGLVLLAVVLINFFSAIGSAILQPIPGDLELTEMGVAIAAFAFLPFCQLTAANVSADIFTARASPKVIAMLRIVADLVAMVFALILLWRMSYGMLDQFTYGYTTSILRLPHWIAFVPILVSLALLVLAALMSFLKHLSAFRMFASND